MLALLRVHGAEGQGAGLSSGQRPRRARAQALRLGFEQSSRPLCVDSSQPGTVRVS